MKRVSLIAAVLALQLVCAGCMHSVGLGQRAVVQAMGIDYQDGEFSVTMQMYDTQGKASESSDVRIARARGKTLTEILSNSAVEQGKQLFLGSMHLVIIGEGLAQKGTAETLRFLNATQQIPPTLTLAVCEGEAGALMEKGAEAQAFSAHAIFDTVTAAQKSGRAPRVELLDMIAALESEEGTVAGMIPLLAIEEEAVKEKSTRPQGDPLLDQLLGGEGKEEPASGGSEDEEGASSDAAGGKEEKAGKQQGQASRLLLAGAAVLQEGRMEQIVPAQETQALCLLGDQAQVMPFTVSGPVFGRASVVTYHISSKIDPEPMADNIVFRVQVELRGTLLETQEPMEMGEQELRVVAALLEKQIRADLERALSAACHQGYDPLGLARTVRRRLPAFYEGHAGKWSSVMEDAGFDVTVSCRVDRTGAQK